MAKKRIQGTDRLFEETEAITSIFTQGEEAVQRSIPIHRLVPNRFNPRQVYSKEALEELIRSMEKYGFIGALDGRELPDGRVELAYGSRRLLAAKAVGIQAIPVFLHDWDDDRMRFVALVENLAREDLTPIDEVITVGKMHKDLGLSTREISRRIGRPRSWVQDRLALFNAPQDVRDMVADRPDTLRAARFISRLPNEEDRLLLREKLVNQEMTTRQVQRAVQQIERGVPAADALIAAVTFPRPRAKPSPEQEASRPDASTGPTGSPEPEALITMVMPSGAQSPILPPVLEQEAPFAEALGATQQIPSSSLEMDAGSRILTREASLMPDRGWLASGSPLIVLAVEALDSFNPEGLSDSELEDALIWLRKLASRANLLLQDLEERL